MTFEHDALKLSVIYHILRARAAHPELFARGTYRPLAAHGPRGDHIFAFARRLAAASAIIVVPRLTHAFALGTPPIGEIWRDTELHLPQDLARARWRDAISGREITLPQRASTDPALTIPVPISLVLSSAPVAVLLDHSSTTASTSSPPP